MTISVATKEQLIEVHKLSHKIWHIAYKEVITTAQIEYMLKMMYSLESLQNQMENGHIFLLAKEKNEFVGYASYEINNGNSNKAKLHKLYVLPEIQGKGFGKLLVEYIVKQVANSKNTALFLNVNKKNKAKFFYEKQGFSITEEIVLNIGNGYVMDDYIMEKQV